MTLGLTKTFSDESVAMPTGASSAFVPSPPLLIISTGVKNIAYVIDADPKIKILAIAGTNSFLMPNANMLR